jgi:hypothetical protein
MISAPDRAPILRQRTGIEDRLSMFSPASGDTPSDRYKNQVVRSIVSVLRYADTRDRLRAETLDLIMNGDPTHHDANTIEVENNIAIHAHLGRLTGSVIESTLLFGDYVQDTAPDMSIPGTIYDAFTEVQRTYGEGSDQARQVEDFMPLYGLVPVNGQDFIGIRTRNVY